MLDAFSSSHYTHICVRFLISHCEPQILHSQRSCTRWKKHSDLPMMSLISKLSSKLQVKLHLPLMISDYIVLVVKVVTDSQHHQVTSIPVTAYNLRCASPLGLILLKAYLRGHLSLPLP